MRIGVVAAALVAVMLCGCRSRTGERAQADREPARNIILITIDTWRADAAGFAGNRDIKTPFLDSLAQRGTRFTNAHAHNVITLPSHVNILTGLYPYQHGVRENAGFVLDPKQTTIAGTLQRNGFATAAFIGALPLDKRYGLNHGFDVYDDNYGKGSVSLDFRVQERPASAVLASATAWWRSVAGRKRFMWVHLYDPHAPYTPPEPFASEYRSAPYLGEVAAVDSALSSALAPLLRPDTVVLVTGDHGEALGDHGELTHGLFAYEATLHVPLLIAGPGIPHGQEDAFVRHVDIVPTLLELAGLAIPLNLPGQSLLHDVSDRDSYFESLSAFLNRGWAPLTGVIHDRAKYIDLPIAELYELPRDPSEQHNVRDEERRAVDVARKILSAAGDVRAVRNAGITAEEAARLRSLGYFSGGSGGKSEFTAADDPKNLVAIDRQMHEIIQLYEHGDTRRALAVAREVVSAQPNMAAGRELYAFALQENERIPEAIGQLRAAVATGNTTNDTKARLALLLTETGRANEAVVLLRPLAAGNDPDILNAYGVALADEGKGAEAVRQFERVLALDSNNAPALQNLGIVALRAGNVNRAREYLTRALELNPRLPLALNTMGVVLARSGDLPGAVAMWRRAVAIDPRQYDALFNIAKVESNAGHREEARQALMQFVRTAPPARYRGEIAAAKQALAQLR